MKRMQILLWVLISSVELLFGDYKIHKLQADETIWRVSRKYNLTVQEICDFNQIKDVTKVREGTVLKIPVKTSSVKSATVTKTSKNYLNTLLPVKGNIKPFVNTHFRGIVIFSSSSDRKVRYHGKGEVSFTGHVNGYGLTVMIKRDDGYLFSYSGFDEIYVTKGQKIDTSLVIGKTGNFSKYNRDGILYSIQLKGKFLKFDMEKELFYNG